MKTNNLLAVRDQFLQHGKVIKNFQPTTIKGYRVMFGLFVKMTNVETLDQLSTEVIEQFLHDGRVDRNWSVCTFRTYFKQLRAFCNWCVKKKLLPRNYTDNIDKPPLEKRLPKYLSPEQCELVLETAYHLKYHYKSEGVRNRALIATIIFAGLSDVSAHGTDLGLG